MFLGYFPIADSYQLTFYFQFVNTTGSAANPTSPTWRMYEQNSGTVVTNSTLSQLDTSGGGATVPGLYYGQVTIASGTGTGMEDDKEYVIRGTGTVDGETPAGIHVFRTGYAPANTRAISGDTVAADNLESMLDGTGGTTLSLKQLNIVNSTGDALVASSTGSNGAGIRATGNGTGPGIFTQGGSGAQGLAVYGGGVGAAPDNDGMIILAGTGGKDGLDISGTTSGIGVRIQGGGTNTGSSLLVSGGNGPAVTFQGAGTGTGLELVGSGSRPGLHVTGGSTAHGAVIHAASGSTGDGLHVEGPIAFASLTAGAGHGAALYGKTGGDGFRATGSSGGHGVAGIGGNSNGQGARFEATGGNAAGLYAQGFGVSPGAHFQGGTASGPGAFFEGSATNGDGLVLQGRGTGNALEALVAAGEPLSQNIEDQLVDANWDEILTPHSTLFSAGRYLQDISPAAFSSVIWEELLTLHPTFGTAGYFVHHIFKILRNRMKIDGATNTMIIYQDDEVTPLFTWNTKDSLGGPSTSPIFERDPI